MYQLSPNIELLFTEAGEHPDRVRAAAAAGFDAVEMWGTSTVDVEALAAALDETGVALTSVLAEPRTNFALPWETLDAFFEGLATGHRERAAAELSRASSSAPAPGSRARSASRTSSDSSRSSARPSSAPRARA